MMDLSGSFMADNAFDFDCFLNADATLDPGAVQTLETSTVAQPYSGTEPLAASKNGDAQCWDTLDYWTQVVNAETLSGLYDHQLGDTNLTPLLEDGCITNPVELFNVELSMPSSASEAASSANPWPPIDWIDGLAKDNSGETVGVRSSSHARFVIKGWVREWLQQSLAQNPYPDKAEQEHLAQIINLFLKQVQTWMVQK